MNGGSGRVPRLVVGISRSRASWWALAWAVGEARRRGARLLLVNVFRPPVTSSTAIFGQVSTGNTPRDPCAERVADGNALIRTAIAQAVSWMPGDVAMEQQVIPGRPTAELASLAWGGDLLVLGSRRPGMAAPARARLGGACLRAARGLPGCGRARTVAQRTDGLSAGQLGRRPPVPLDAAPRSAVGFMTICCARTGRAFPSPCQARPFCPSAGVRSGHDGGPGSVGRRRLGVCSPARAG